MFARTRAHNHSVWLKSEGQRTVVFQGSNLSHQGKYPSELSIYLALFITTVTIIIINVIIICLKRAGRRDLYMLDQSSVTERTRSSANFCSSSSDPSETGAYS